MQPTMRATVLADVKRFCTFRAIDWDHVTIDMKSELWNEIVMADTDVRLDDALHHRGRPC